MINGPDRAGVGSNTTPPPTATAGGPSLSGTPAGTAFPLTQSVLGINPLSKAIGISTSSGATLTTRTGGYQLQVPDLGIDITLPGNGSSQPVTNGTISLALGASDFVFGGVWGFAASDPQSSTGSRYAPFVSGYRTAERDVPYLGTATYSATDGLAGTVFVRDGSNVATGVLEGDVSLVADFFNEKISGSFTNIEATNVQSGQVSNWNNVSINADLNYNHTRNWVVGTAAASSAPNTQFALDGTASGSFAGYFYGPGADELGAVWSIENGAFSADGAATGFIVADRTSGTVSANNRNAYLINVLPRGDVPTTGTAVVGTPLAAGQDVSTYTDRFASSGGPTFTGSGGFPALLIEYPLHITTLQFGANGFSSVATADDARMTLYPSTVGQPYVNSYMLAVPALSVFTSFSAGTSNPGGIFANPVAETAGNDAITTFGLSYVEFGAWLRADYSTGIPAYASYFGFGYETPSAAMPSSGTATYADAGGVQGSVFVSIGSAVSSGIVSGGVSLTANFSSGAITGSFSNMHVYTRTTAAPWNDVSVSASIAAGTNSFSGSTATTSAPGGQLSLKNGAAGHIDGAFYGPNAENLGAVWTLSNGDGTGSAIGTVGATKH